MEIHADELEDLCDDDKPDFFAHISEAITRYLKKYILDADISQDEKLLLVRELNEFQLKCLTWNIYKNGLADKFPVRISEDRSKRLPEIEKGSILEFMLNNDFSNESFCRVVNELCEKNPFLNELISVVFWSAGRKFFLGFKYLDL